MQRDLGEPAPTLADLLVTLGNADSFVRSTTIFKLEVSDPAASVVLPRLADLARTDAEPLVRIAAVEALRRLRVSAAIPAIVEALAIGIRRCACAAALALGDLPTVGDSGVLTALTNHVDNHPRVREAVAVAIRRIQPNPGACWQVVVSNNY